MTCYHPIPACRADSGTPWRLNPQLGTENARIPCGTCLGCRTDNALDWTRRCIHEARLWKENRFLTLTYNDENLPRELKPDDLTKFFKRLRKAADGRERRIVTERRGNIRYLACGEYGEKTERPHYHAILFNIGFADEQKYSEKLSESTTLSRIWGKGTAKLAPFTAATAGYVAGYLTKSNRRTYADENGEIRHPPFRRASTKPAIGRQWLEKYPDDLQHGYMIVDERKTRIPRYYIKRLLITHQQRTEDLQQKAIKELDSRTPARLQDQETIHRQQVDRKTRNL